MITLFVTYIDSYLNTMIYKCNSNIMKIFLRAFPVINFKTKYIITSIIERQFLVK